MKAKTIEKIINKKFDNFVTTITDKKVQEIIKNNTIVTGGCIVSMLLNEDVNDYDLYFKDFNSAKVIAKYFVNLYINNKTTKSEKVPELFVQEDNNRIRVVVKSAGIDSDTTNNSDYRFFETLDPGSPQQDKFIDSVMEVIAKDSKDKNDKYKPVFITSNAITLTNDMQLIFRFFGEPEDIHKNYDFVHCTNYWNSKDKKLTLNQRAIESLLTKDLLYTGSLYPICSMIRLRKFMKRGWIVTAGQMFKIAFQISKLDLTDYKVLEDQLIGVDVAYFGQLLNELKKVEGQDISDIYIMELVDKIF